VCWVEPTPTTQRFGVVLLAPWTLLKDASCQAEDTGVSAAFDVDLQPGWGGGLCWDCLRDSLGFGMPCVPPDPGAETHISVEL